jgi:topoisomerase (DNA) II binding protein 1
VDLMVSGEGNDIYLSGCRVFLAGFNLADMRRLVRLVLGGGGTRYVEFNDRVTHVVLGKPSER